MRRRRRLVYEVTSDLMWWVPSQRRWKLVGEDWAGATGINSHRRHLKFRSAIRDARHLDLILVDHPEAEITITRYLWVKDRGRDGKRKGVRRMCQDFVMRRGETWPKSRRKAVESGV